MSRSPLQTASISGGVMGGSGLGAASTPIPLPSMERTSAIFRLITASKSPCKAAGGL